MIRLLWLFLILDFSLTTILLIGDLITGATSERSDIWLRITIELATLAIIEAIREKKV